MSAAEVRFNDSALIRSPAAHAAHLLQDMRCLRAALPSERLLDPRHYGSHQGVGARLALLIEHVGIKRSGTLTVTSAEANSVRLHGELPPVDYDIVLSVHPDEAGCRLDLTAIARPQPLLFYRMRTRAKVKAHLATDLPRVFEGLAGRLKAAIEATPIDPRFQPQITIDGYVEACARADIPRGGRKALTLLDRPIVLFDVEGALYALPDRCPHAGAPLSEGAVSGHVLTCARHGRQYDLRTGARLDDPRDSVATYVVRVADDTIWVRLQLV